MNSQGQYQLVFGDSSKMDILRTGEVDLVLTGPPYFSDATEELLREPFRKQKDIERAKQEVSAFAIGLRPVYEEIRRVLRPGGYLVTQTKDLCYGGIFISLTALHRELAEATGLHLLSHIYWHKFKRNSDSKRFLDTPLAGSFRNDYVEDICIFSDQPIDPKSHGLVELSKEEIQKSVSPVWVIGPASKNREHPHKTPRALVRRLIALLTDPGDLVVDPFAGSGTTLEVAVSMGRRAVGYEIQERYVKVADNSVQRSIKKVRRKDP